MKHLFAVCLCTISVHALTAQHTDLGKRNYALMKKGGWIIAYWFIPCSRDIGRGLTHGVFGSGAPCPLQYLIDLTIQQNIKNSHLTKQIQSWKQENIDEEEEFSMYVIREAADQLSVRQRALRRVLLIRAGAHLGANKCCDWGTLSNNEKPITLPSKHGEVLRGCSQNVLVFHSSPPVQSPMGSYWRKVHIREHSLSGLCC